MRADIDEVLRRAGGVTTRRRLLSVVTRNQFDHEVRTGRLVAPFTGAFCRPWDAEFVVERAALVSVGPPSALSHVSALQQWTAIDRSADELIHVCTPATRCLAPRLGMHIHRVAMMPPTLRVNGLPTVALPDALIASWPLLSARDRRAPLISAVRRRLVRPADIAISLGTIRRVSARAELADLVRLLAEDCESELEIWGCLGVFDVPGLRHGKRQLWVDTPAGRYRADIGYAAERVAVELDGARYHGSREQRERDMRRDAAFASIDWLTMRFSYARLHADVAGCRRDTLATLAARRSRFRSA
jgi:very-short-patch-repair endonuclease